MDVFRVGISSAGMPSNPFDFIAIGGGISQMRSPRHFEAMAVFFLFKAPHKTGPAIQKPTGRVPEHEPRLPTSRLRPGHVQGSGLGLCCVGIRALLAAICSKEWKNLCLLAFELRSR